MSAENNRVERASGNVALEDGPSNAGTGRLADRIDHERIAARAYQIYESQHRADGHADDHWRQAEAEYTPFAARARAGRAQRPRHSDAWMLAGRTASVNLPAQYVTFER